MAEPTFVIFVNGSYGVGTSSVLDHVADQLASSGQAFSLFDVAWFHRPWPTAPDDPMNRIIEARNIAAVWRTTRAPSRQPVIAGVIETAADRQRYADAFGLPVRSVLLTAGPEVASVA